MKLTTRLAAGAAIAVVAAVPATAAAKPVTQNDVKKEVVAANKSLDKVVSLVHRNRDGASIVHLRNYKRHVKTAAAQTRRLRRNATASPAGARAYTGSVKKLALVSDECADALSKIVGNASGDAQIDIAGTIKACIVTRTQLIDQLTALLDDVPDSVKPLVTQVIAMLSTQGGDDANQITNQLGDTDLPSPVAGILKQALEIATGAIDDAQTLLQSIVGLVPPQLQPIIKQALDMVSDQIDMVQDLIGNLLSGLLGNTTGTNPSPGGTGSTGTGLGGLLGNLPFGNLLSGLFGSGFPGNLSPINLPFNIPGFSFFVK
jgi:hypothetical protein